MLILHKEDEIMKYVKPEIKVEQFEMDNVLALSSVVPPVRALDNWELNEVSIFGGGLD